MTELQDGFHAQHVIEKWISFYNARRTHSALEHQTLVEAYWASENQKQAAWLSTRIVPAILSPPMLTDVMTAIAVVDPTFEGST